MANNIALVIRREFLERVKKKSFIITTILMPVLMLAMMAAPALIMMVSGSEERDSPRLRSDRSRRIRCAVYPGRNDGRQGHSASLHQRIIVDVA